MLHGHVHFNAEAQPSHSKLVCYPPAKFGLISKGTLA